MSSDFYDQTKYIRLMRPTIDSHMAYPKAIASTFRAVAPTLFGFLQLVRVVEVVRSSTSLETTDENF